MLSTVMYVQPANILVREEGNKEISKDGEIIADGDEERESKVSDEMKAVCEMLHYIKIGVFLVAILAVRSRPAKFHRLKSDESEDWIKCVNFELTMRSLL